MKKILFCVIFVLAVSIAGAAPLDFVVLLDVSESMFRYFDRTVEYLIGDILNEHLEVADGFHLLSFASFPEMELSLDLESDSDLDGALDRVGLLQPLGKYTDLVSAFRFLFSYTSSVRQDSRKRILVLTDGIHDPPPGSPYPLSAGTHQPKVDEIIDNMRKMGWDLTLVRFPEELAALPVNTPEDSGDTNVDDADATNSDGAESGTTSTGTGTDTGSNADSSDNSENTGQNTGTQSSGSGTADPNGSTATQTPTTDNGANQDTNSEDQSESENGENIFDDYADDEEVEVIPFPDEDNSSTNEIVHAPKLIYPDDLGRVGYKFTIPIKIENQNNERILIELDELLWAGIDILVKPASKTVNANSTRTMRLHVALPASTEPGPRDLALTAGFSDDLRSFPRKATISIDLRAARTPEGTRTLDILPILGYTGAGLGGLAVLALLVFAVRRLVLSSIAAAGSSPVVRGGGTSGDRAVEMHVDGQNPNIGTRNVNGIRDGGSKSVGGGISAFLVYMYQFPIRVAEVSRKGDSYTFTPIKPDFCESTAPINDCLDKEIRLVSANKRLVTVRFRRYVSALEKINRIMRLTDEPGPRKDFSG